VGDVLDSLFSVLPVVLLILWFLRRFSGSRRRSGGAATAKRSAERKTSASDSASGGAAESERPTRSKAPRGTFARAAQEFRDALAGETTVPSAVPGEDELYDRMDHRRVEAAANSPVPPRPAVRDDRHSIMEPRPKVTKDKPVASNSAVDRINRLSPVARGLVWSFVFSEPPSLKDWDR